MAIITKTSIAGLGQRTAAETTLSASDTFAYTARTGQLLILRNPTAGALSPVIVGADATTASFEGYAVVSVAAGYPVTSIAPGAVKVIPLDTIRYYLEGTITITNGTGLVAILLGA